MASKLIIPDRGTLREIASQAATSRDERQLASSELLVPAVHLAQQVTEELLAYALDDGQALYGGQNRYHIFRVSWKTGSFGKRQTHRASVLGRHNASCLFWDPTKAEIGWDLNNPPSVPVTLEFWRKKNQAHLPTASILAEWVDDALPLLEKVLAEQEKSTRTITAALEKVEKIRAALDI